MTVPDIDRFEERAAIAEHDGGCSRTEAEDLATQEQGFLSAGSSRTLITLRMSATRTKAGSCTPGYC